MAPLSDREIAALRLTDPVAWARAVDPSYDASCRASEERKRGEAEAAMPPRPVDLREAVTKGALLTAMRDFVAGLMERVVQPILDRLDALERREHGAGVVIRTDGVHIEAPLDDLANSMARVEAAITAPTEPIYDERGRLVGAKKRVSDPPPVREVVREARSTSSSIPANLAERLAALEARVGPLSLLLGRSQPERLAEIERMLARVKALEERPALAYAGTWAQGSESKAGFFYTAKGSVWYCRRDTRDRPGESDAWQLACKAGRDGR
jgi:hypothetical protein